MKPRSDSRLFKLSVEQQAQLYDWIHKLGYVKAKELAALPPPDGFGIKTYLNSLCRFVARYSEMQKEREFFNILRCASGELHPQMLRAAETMAHQMAFNLALGALHRSSFVSECSVRSVSPSGIALVFRHWLSRSTCS
jgi:hypothetical protein